MNVQKVLYLCFPFVFSQTFANHHIAYAAPVQNINTNQTINSNNSVNSNNSSQIPSNTDSTSFKKESYATPPPEASDDLYFADHQTWAWAGAGFIFVPNYFAKYVTEPIVAYQIGLARSYWRDAYNNTHYVALIADTGYSIADIDNQNRTIDYSLSNITAVFGYERPLMQTEFFSFLLEVGPSLGKRDIYQIKNGSLTHATSAYVLNADINTGFNVIFTPRKKVRYSLRAVVQFTTGTTIHQKGLPNGNPFMIYIPTVGATIRW